MSQENHSGRPQGRPADGQPRPPRGEAQLRGPFLLFFVAAVLWLLASSVLGLVAALKLHLPELLVGCETFTYGRVAAAAQNLFVYGWAFNALFAVNLWLLAQLSRFELRNGWLASLGGLFWNVALLYGTLRIFAGEMTGYSLLEMPREVGPLLAVSFLLAGFWPIVAFSRRPTGHSFSSHWYVVAGTFAFPIVYALAQLVMFWCPASGVVQALAQGWYAQNLLLLWLGASGLAATYYFIPKILGRPLHGYYLASVGFWTYFLFAGWTGPASLLGSPIPVWVQSAGVVAAVMLIVPVLITAINFHGTLSADGGWSRAWNSTTLRFVAFGAVSFTLAGVLGAVFSTRGFNAAVRFTEFAKGQELMLTYAFLSMVVFGAAYFILPRLTGSLWPSAKLVHLHFWTTAAGVIGAVFTSLAHGWLSGHQAAFAGLPVSWAAAGSLFAFLLLVGHVAFALNAFGMILSSKSPAADGRSE